MQLYQDVLEVLQNAGTVYLVVLFGVLGVAGLIIRVLVQNAVITPQFGLLTANLLAWPLGILFGSIGFMVITALVIPDMYDFIQNNWLKNADIWKRQLQGTIVSGIKDSRTRGIIGNVIGSSPIGNALLASVLTVAFKVIFGMVLQGFYLRRMILEEKIREYEAAKRGADVRAWYEKLRDLVLAGLKIGSRTSAKQEILPPPINPAAGRQQPTPGSRRDQSGAKRP
jgi:hypothetical protein